MAERMWFEELPGRTWASLWSGYILCGNCRGIRHVQNGCSGCDQPPPRYEPVRMRHESGEIIEVPPCDNGAEGRYEDWLYLQMIEREWKRPLTNDEQPWSVQPSPSPRAAIVLLFWTYFETRIERLLRERMRSVPKAIVEDLVERNSSIGSRLDRLYRVVFSSTYAQDLRELGYATIDAHLSRVQRCRNEFVHGRPQAIDDAFVEDVVRLLKAEHEAWIAVFNRRTARPGKA